MYQLSSSGFPNDFFFGIADADLQVIGEASTLQEEQSEPSLWTHFGKNSGKVVGNETPLIGVDKYHRWKEDVELMKQLGVKHYRMSFSMCRTMHRDGSVNEKAIAWYRQYLTALKNAGITVYGTIFHWELPLWMHEKGGWKNREVTDALVRHAEIVQEHFSQFVEEFFILNEPFQFTLLAYHLGEHAPGETSLKNALQTVHHALLAQGKVFRALKQKDPTIKLGTVYNSRVFYALSTNEEDLKAAEMAAQYQTRIFTDPLYLGKYPEELKKKCAAIWPVIEPGDMEVIRIGDGLSSFGLNFYRGMVIRADATAELGFAEVQFPQGVKNGLGWPVYVNPTYSEGMYDALRELYHRYGEHGMKRIYISENGTCWDDRIGPDGKVHDEFRMYFIREHLKQGLKAILAGVPLKGYFLWTLTDNYEWDLGFKPGSNFGIVHIERPSLDRTPKDSFYWYKDVIARHGLDRL